MNTPIRKRRKAFPAALLSLLFAVSFLFSAPIAVSALEVPDLSHSKASLLYCIEADSLLYANNSTLPVAPGVLTKLMVAVVAIEEAEAQGKTLNTPLTASRAAIRATTGAHIAMKEGEIFALRDLIAVMIHTGADDAAHVIAEGLAGSFDAFVTKMNEKAAALGMTNTVFTNVTGIHDDEMVTTVEDLLKLTLHAVRIQELSEMASLYRVVIDATNRSETRYYGTRNYLISSRVNPDYYLPMATGFLCGTDRDNGFSVIATARKDGLNYIAIVCCADNQTVLVSPERTEVDEEGNTVTYPAEYKTLYHGLYEARDLLIFGEESYGYIKAVDRSTPIVELPVRLASGVDSITLLPESALEIYVPNDIDRDKEITYRWTLEKEELTAPVKAGEQLGTLYVYYRGELLGEVALITRNNVERSAGLTLLARAQELISTPFFLVLIGLILFAAIFYILSTAITRQRKAAERRREMERSKRYLK